MCINQPLLGIERIECWLGKNDNILSVGLAIMLVCISFARACCSYQQHAFVGRSRVSILDRMPMVPELWTATRSRKHNGYLLPVCVSDTTG